MVSEGRGRLFRRKDGKFLVYLPKDLCEDSMFPFPKLESLKIKVSFKPGAKEPVLFIENLPEEESEEEG